jgi:PAS domain S-box-containing protein
MNGTDEGGEAPCFAHLLDEPSAHPDALFAQLVAHLADAVVIADVGGAITFWNDAATRLFGFTASEAIGRTLDLIIPERLRARHWSGYREVMTTGHTGYGDKLLEVPALRADGETISIAFTVTLLPGADGKPNAIAAVLRDDTQRFRERKEMQAGRTLPFPR